MRTPPYIKLAWFDGFRCSCGVEYSAKDKQKPLEKVVGHPALCVHLVESEELQTMNERSKSRKTR